MMDLVNQRKGEVRRVKKKRLSDALFPDVGRYVIHRE